MNRLLLMEPGYGGAALGLAVFLAIFIAALLWMYRPGARPEYERGAKLPLEDGTPPPHRRRRDPDDGPGNPHGPDGSSPQPRRRAR